MIYTSVNNPKIKLLKRLQEKKYRDNESLFLVEGRHLTEEAYKNGYLKELLIPIGSKYKLDVDTHEIGESVINYLTQLNSSTGIFGVCMKKEMKLKEGKILILDSIQDPGNMGTIIRSSVAFNFDTIVINDKCADIYSSKVIRATQGMIFYANIIKKELKTFIKDIKKNHKIYVTNVDGGKKLKNIEKNKKIAIIMGSEGQGVSEELMKLKDEYLYIPTNDKCESLNVAVAASIIMWYFGGD